MKRLCMAIVLLALAATTRPQSGNIRVGVNLVVLNAAVTDPKGDWVSGLQKENFEILEDGIPQEIAYFDSGAEPYNLALALDTSASVRPELKILTETASRFVRDLRPIDRVTLITFGDFVRRLTEYSADRDEIAGQLNRLPIGGQTALYDAIYLMLADTQARRSGRNALVILTDGIDIQSVSSVSEVAGMARLSNCALYVLCLEATSQSKEYRTSFKFLKDFSSRAFWRDYYRYIDSLEKPVSSEVQPHWKAEVDKAMKTHPISAMLQKRRNALRELTELSGGAFITLASLKDASGAYAKIAMELKSSYGLGYYAGGRSDGPELRNIEVRIRNVPCPKCTVRSRRTIRFQPNP